MNYKSGDLVKITGNCTGHLFKIGETVRLKEYLGGMNRLWEAEYLDGHDWWYVCESDMAPVKPATMPQKIVITTDGKTTLARLFDGKTMVKRAEAKCAPSDTFDFGVGAELAVKRLMGDNPATESIKESELVKLYCVKSHEPGEWITKGKIYELDADGIIHFDDGYSLGFRGIGDHASVKLNLVPLVRRPAKVGEWVYINNAGFAPCGDNGVSTYKNGDVMKIIGIEWNNNWFRYRKGSNSHGTEYVLNQNEYLVLDGYTGDPA